MPGTAEIRFAAGLSPARPAYLDHHRLYGTVVVPAASHVAMALEAAAALDADGACLLADLVFPHALVLADGARRDAHLVLGAPEVGGGRSLRLVSDAGEHLRGRFAPLDPAPARPPLAGLTARFGAPIEDPYPAFAAHGYTLGAAFRWIREVRAGSGEALARLGPEPGANGAALDAAPYVLHAGLIDSCFQAICGTRIDGVAALAPDETIFIPFAIEAVRFGRRPVGGTTVHAVVRGGAWAGADGLPGPVDLVLYDETGTSYAEILGFEGRRIPRAALLALRDRGEAEHPAQAEELRWSAAVPTRPPAPTDDAATLALTDRDASGPALLGEAVRRLAEGGARLRRVALVTHGVTDGAAERPWGGLLRGLAAALRIERPDLEVVTLDLPADGAAAPDGLVVTLPDGDWRWREGGLARAALAPHRTETPYALHQENPGLLDHLAPVPILPPTPGTGEILVEVEAAGLNFRDVLTAMGAYPGEVQPLGGEVAGRVVSVGPEVADLRPGDAVVAFSFGRAGLATHVAVRAALAAPRPDALTPAQAVTLPVTAATARHALLDLADLRAGETVLIHAGAGGVGLAAVRLALAQGAIVLATAGTPEKRARLLGLGVRAVGDSRSADFARDLAAAMPAAGLDVALNTLAGPMVPATLALLRPGGRFVELGKRDVLDRAEALALRPDIAFHTFDLVALAAREPERVRAHLDAALAEAAAGAGGLPFDAFPLREGARAFRHMSQARHVGKVVCTREAAFRPRRDGTYLITGGLGALGRASARRLAERGAGAIVLAGRDPEPGAAAALAGLGTRIVVERADIAAPGAAAALVRRIAEDPALPPLRGVFHAAGHLEDGLLADLDAAAVDRVLAPKTAGTLALAEALAGLSLDAFVLFSSAVATLGAAGQAAYAAANGFMDALALSLRRRGVPATAIGWGPWDGAGMAARLGAVDRARLARRGLEPMHPEAALDALMALAGPTGPAHALVLRRCDGAERAHAAPADAVTDSVPVAPAPVAPQAVEDHLMRAVASVAGAASGTLDPRRTFKELGFDSLMAVELRGALTQSLGVSLPATLVFDYPTPEALAAHLRALLAAAPEGEPDDAAGERQASDAKADDLPDDLPDDLADDPLDDLDALNARLDAILQDEAPERPFATRPRSDTGV